MQIHFYAGAADAAGRATLVLDAGALTAGGLLTAGGALDGGALTAGDLVDHLGSGNERLARVLGCCSLLVDGLVVRDPGQQIPVGSRVDVLPPFAGG